MAAENLITADWSELREISSALENWSLATREPLGKLMRQEMGLILQRVMQAYPPFAHPLQTSFAGQSRIGKAAVSRDVGRVYVTINEVFEELQAKAGGVTGDARLAKAWYGLWRRGEFDEVRRVLEEVGSDYARVAMGPALERSHHLRRRSRGGRVGGRYHSQMVTAAELSRYRRELHSRVMWAKAGWLAGATRFGSKGIPVAVRKLGLAPGAAIDQSRRLNDPHVVAINRVSYAGYLEARGRIVPRVLRHRVDVIARKTAAILAKGWRPRR